jgi:hypothetical protein
MNNETMGKSYEAFWYTGPRPQVSSLSLLHFIQLYRAIAVLAIAVLAIAVLAIAVLATCPRRQGYKNATFIVSLSGDQTRSTYVARSGANRSAIHYDCTFTSD